MGHLIKAAFWATAAAILFTAAVNIYVTRSVSRFILDKNEAKESGFDCALVLGARVYPSGTLSPMLEDRVLTGTELYKRGAVPSLMMSGDHKKSYDEVDAMRKYALKEGLPEKAIFMDYAGYSTYESMYRAKNTFGVKKAFIVTQEFHLGRALYIARALGIDAYGVAADRRPYRNIWYNYAREYLARVKDFFTAIVKPKPAKSGKIPVAGGGNTLEG